MRFLIRRTEDILSREVVQYEIEADSQQDAISQLIDEDYRGLIESETIESQAISHTPDMNIDDWKVFIKKEV